MLTVRLSAHMEQRLNALVTATQRTKSFYVRAALERSLKDLEDAYLAKAAYERFKISGGKAIPLEEVMREHNLGD